MSKWTLDLAIRAPWRAPSPSCISDLRRSTLIILGLFSPMANIMASSMLLLPEPLGPDIETRPGSNWTVVLRNPNDLNP